MTYYVTFLEMSHILCMSNAFHTCWRTHAWQQFACLLVTSSWLLLIITIITAYMRASNGRAPKQRKQATCHQATLVAEMANGFRHNSYVYSLYLRCENTILAILCMNLPITTTIAGEQLICFIFYNDTKCITTNGYMIIYVGAEKHFPKVFCVI